MIQHVSLNGPNMTNKKIVGKFNITPKLIKTIPVIPHSKSEIITVTTF